MDYRIFPLKIMERFQSKINKALAKTGAADYAASSSDGDDEGFVVWVAMKAVNKIAAAVFDRRHNSHGICLRCSRKAVCAVIPDHHTSHPGTMAIILAPGGSGQQRAYNVSTPD